jgi:hypothetical protein
MRRLFALIWLALSLAFASGPAYAMTAADCPMSASSSSSAMHHDSNDCCKPACAANCVMACPAMVAPSRERAAVPVEQITKQLVAIRAAPLHSIDLTTTDPPPRIIFS